MFAALFLMIQWGEGRKIFVPPAGLRQRPYSFWGINASQSQDATGSCVEISRIGVAVFDPTFKGVANL